MPMAEVDLCVVAEADGPSVQPPPIQGVCQRPGQIDRHARRDQEQGEVRHLLAMSRFLPHRAIAVEGLDKLADVWAQTAHTDHDGATDSPLFDGDIG